jgi:hypothetical protein
MGGSFSEVAGRLPAVARRHDRLSATSVVDAALGEVMRLPDPVMIFIGPT